MANLALLFTMSIISLESSLPSVVSDTTHQATSTVAKDQVPCITCTECENPCQPPPPPPVIELCPPPPPPPSPPLPPPKPPCGPCETLPPPKPPCEGETCLPSLEPPMPWVPKGTPMPLFPPPGSYYPPGTQSPHEPDNNDNNDGGKLMPAMCFMNPSSYSMYFTILQSSTFVAFLSIPYYLFV